ncbi:peptide chain release factor 2 [Bacillus cereus]|uniref:Peptide chain release factor 2 n=1 Tax=Bacillus cereus TaxID=1396 RepID=A0A2B0TU71_BACCE|nr:peptide chain release factor 2 [Bacillus cereus]PFU39186.1 peptide chain release factor 2 [Bacillus cereus]
MLSYESNSNYIEVKEMELVEIRQELEKMAKRLAAFRGSL